MSDLKTIFDNFKGSWNFERRIASLETDKEEATAQGTAEFTQQENASLAYEETGKLNLSTGQSLPFYRHYLYTLEENAMHVFYGDGPQTGQLYQTYRMKENDLHAEAVHVCGEDLYEGEYTRLGRDAFTMTQRVKGPRKNQRITTHFTRKTPC